MSDEHHAIHTIKHILEDLPPIKEKKDPVLAGALGLLLGGIGLGLYFRSWKDFLYPILVFILLSVVVPGLGSFAGAIFTCIWGVVRAVKSG